MTLLFEKHLEMTTPGVLRGSDTPFADEYRDELAENVTEVLRTFANGLDESADLGTSFDSFCHHYELSEEDAAWIQDVLIETTKLAFGGRRDADDDAIRSFLKTLSQPFPKPTKTPPNQDGMTPRAGEHAIKEFLRKLEVAKHPDPFGNDGYSADKYKAFDREANRYGRNYSYKNDYNNQTPSRPLANPTLNVDTGNKAFEAVDSVGMGVPMHFRVVNKLTNEYVTKPIHKEEALQIASDLNREFKQVLDENNLSTSDVDKALTEASRGAKNLPSLPIQEGLNQPLNPRYLEALNRQNFTSAGSLVQSDHTVNHAKEFLKTQQLINERKEKFGENLQASEFNAIRSVQQKGLKQ